MQTLILLNTLGVQCYLASYLSSSMYQIPSFIKEREREGGVSERSGSPIRCYVHCVALLSTKESSILQKRTKTPNFLPFSQLVQTK